MLETKGLSPFRPYSGEKFFRGLGLYKMIKKFLCMLSVTTAVMTASLAYSATLSDSVSLATSTHPLMAAGKAAKDGAQHKMREERANFYPVIGATARTGRLNQDDDTTRANTGGDAYSWLGEGTVTLTQPLYAGFSNVNMSKAAAERRDAAVDDLGSTSEDIALRAARAHLNLMRTRELLDLASQYLKSIQERKDSIALMLSEGAADEAEDLQANEVLMAAKTTRLGYEEAFRQAEADYIQVVGTPPADTLEFGASSWDKLVPTSVDAAMAKAAGNNPKLKSADKMAEALGYEAKAERGGLVPRLDAEMAYTKKDQDDDLGGELESSSALLKMSWNFSTGGGQFARINQGLDRQREARAKRSDTLRNVERDVRQKFTSMNIVEEQFGLFVERESAADRILTNYLSQFEGGKQTNLQLINAHARLFESKAARTDAFYRRLLSRFELLSAMGDLQQALNAASQTAQAKQP